MGMKEFTRKFAENFKLVEKEFIGKPVRYMEIGVFMGWTAEWFIQNILTHNDARYYGIDPWHWFPGFCRRWKTEEEFNTQVLPRIDGLRERFKGKAEFIRGYSKDVLMKTPFDKLDCIYIDGDHTLIPVMQDFALTWPLLKVGGVMIFDDYIHPKTKDVQYVVDTILKNGERTRMQRTAKIELLWKNYSVGIRKIAE